MHRLFISDLHLSDDTPEIEAGLVSLLQREAGFDSLVILGDFFEAWVGDDDNAPLADRIKTLLQALTDGGVDLMIARGNRDFMLGEQFAHDIGGRCYKTRPSLKSPVSRPFSSTVISCARTTVTISSFEPWSIQLSGKLK